MKKLLIANLVLAMVLIFIGAANAQSWWESQEINGSTIKIIYPKYDSKGNKTLGNVNGKFTGYMVVSSTTAVQGTAIEQVFLCGTLSVPLAGITLDVWLDFPDETSFSFAVTDHSAEPTKTDKENADVIAIGTFHDQTDIISGPAYLNGTLTLTEDTGDNIKSVTVKGTVVGGYGQAAGSLYQFSSSAINVVLTPYTGATPLTCVDGVVVPVI